MLNGLKDIEMKVANQHNLVRCDNCSALYDKTLRWVRGYHRDSSDDFTFINSIKENSYPICAKERENV